MRRRLAALIDECIMRSFQLTGNVACQQLSTCRRRGKLGSCLGGSLLTIACSCCPCLRPRSELLSRVTEAERSQYSLQLAGRMLRAGAMRVHAGWQLLSECVAEQVRATAHCSGDDSINLGINLSDNSDTVTQRVSGKLVSHIENRSGDRDSM